jgi:hypothetical protein
MFHETGQYLCFLKKYFNDRIYSLAIAKIDAVSLVKLTSRNRVLEKLTVRLASHEISRLLWLLKVLYSGHRTKHQPLS